MDFVLVGGEIGGVCDPNTCLRPSALNPWRALVTDCVITSNNQHTTAFVLVESTDNSCFDNLERVLLEKASHRAKRVAASLCTVLKYCWPDTEPVSVEVSPKRKARPPANFDDTFDLEAEGIEGTGATTTLPGGVYDCSFDEDASSTPTAAWVLDRGAPADVATKGVREEKMTLPPELRERLSNDSVMDELIH